MVDKAIFTIIEIIVSVVAIMKAIQSLRLYLYHTIPQQLLDLVRQAHLEQEFHTIWDIKVSDKMRAALCTPLTQQQLQTLKLSKDDIVSRSIDGYVISHKLRNGELSGVVSVSIDITSKSGKCNYHYSGVKLRITVDRMYNKWTVTSVTQL